MRYAFLHFASEAAAKDFAEKVLRAGVERPSSEGGCAFLKGAHRIRMQTMVRRKCASLIETQPTAIVTVADVAPSLVRLYCAAAGDGA